MSYGRKKLCLSGGKRAAARGAGRRFLREQGIAEFKLPDRVEW